MIISASRRTDIPSFFGDELMASLRAGSCRVSNPFRPSQVSTVSLRPADVAAIVFWTKHAAPFLRHLAELDAMGEAAMLMLHPMANFSD